tara:strand:- start:9 stop:248 length:240 start_codon:yes stop_codon:yes gene_type:complete
MFRIIIIYELVFIVFWNLLYLSNSGVENWFTEKFLTAVFVFLSTMALSVTLVYIIYLTAKASGFVKTLKKIKDPRLGNN